MRTIIWGLLVTALAAGGFCYARWFWKNWKKLNPDTAWVVWVIVPMLCALWAKVGWDTLNP